MGLCISPLSGPEAKHITLSLSSFLLHRKEAEKQDCQVQHFLLPLSAQGVVRVTLVNDANSALRVGLRWRPPHQQPNLGTSVFMGEDISVPVIYTFNVEDEDLGLMTLGPGAHISRRLILPGHDHVRYGLNVWVEDATQE